MVAERFDTESARAFTHLLKGNLGAGCLALPLVFARLGTGGALGLFAVVALQGTYSMVLIVRCKHAVRAHGLKAQTYEDIGEIAFGAVGRRLIGALVVALQLGVCCIYISLLVTNVHAGVPAVPERAVFLAVSCVCALLSLLRGLSDLWLLSTTANAIMLTAIATAVGVSLRVLAARDGPAEPIERRVTAATVARCLSVEFFAYEGIALVLPVENAFSPFRPGTGTRTSPGVEMLAAHGGDGAAAQLPAAADGHAPSADGSAGLVEGLEAAEERRARRFEALLVAAMGCVALLFVLLGSSVAAAFPHIDSGSVTAFLAEREDAGWWLPAVNALVSLAVLLTYPLQLQPAAMIFDRLCAPPPAVGKPSGWHGPAFVARRVGITAACVFVVFLVPALELLIALLGALCQASLALLPFALSLKLHRLGLVTFSRTRTAVHVVLMAFCGCAMLVGTYSAIADIAAFRAAGSALRL
ncbi:hypothetical protein KFE25_006992 [Diacronema lutheri]|uniref:Amino acid transporter transmembrane domain-containing protein n=1 Tax=Diacronema lutheri TaxID=2081491 RepID=A0A8J5XU24_DIALT|nr:hypothetical protein KFE25_006992 [Diacronema lutheri]